MNQLVPYKEIKMLTHRATEERRRRRSTGGRRGGAASGRSGRRRSAGGRRGGADAGVGGRRGGASSGGSGRRRPAGGRRGGAEAAGVGGMRRVGREQRIWAEAEAGWGEPGSGRAGKDLGLGIAVRSAESGQGGRAV